MATRNWTTSARSASCATWTTDRRRPGTEGAGNPGRRSVRLREHRLDAGRLAGEEALARLVAAVERDDARRHLQLLDDLVGRRLVAPMGHREAAMDLRVLGVLGREVGLEVVQAVERP